MTIKNRTERVYFNYTSAAPFGAEILELRSSGNGNAHVILDKTIFFPEGGGQPSDRGTINGIPLLDVHEKNNEIIHLISTADTEKLKPGPAELILDTRRRRDFTVIHTGQHLLSGIVLRMTGRPTVSVHLGEEICTIDVEAGGNDGPAEMDEETVIAVEEAVADAIEENHSVIVHLCPPEDLAAFPLRKLPPQGEEQIRVIEIEGYDFSPCCGTHLTSTTDIGMLRVLGAEKYKGMTRISFIAGRRVLLDSRLLRQNAGIVSRALSVPLGETGKGMLEFLEKTSRAERRLKALEEKTAQLKAESLLRRAGLPENTVEPRRQVPVVVTESYSEEGMDEVLNIGRIAQKQTSALLILASEPDRKFAAFCTAEGFDLRPLVKIRLEAHGGRGGGGPSFFQGSFGSKEALDAFMGSVKNNPTIGS